DHEHHRQLTLLVRAERLLGKAKTFQLLEILRRELRSVTWNRLPGHRAIGRVLDFVHHLHHLAWMHVDDRRQWAKAPRQLVKVAVELDANRAPSIDLSVDRVVGNVDVAKSGYFANLVVERNHRKTEAEHHQDDDTESLEQRAIRPPPVVHFIVFIAFAHFRTFLPIATTRKPRMATPRTAIPTLGEPEYCARMMPAKNTTAIDARTSAVRRLAARRDSRSFA